MAGIIGNQNSYANKEIPRQLIGCCGILRRKSPLPKGIDNGLSAWDEKKRGRKKRGANRKETDYGVRNLSCVYDSVLF